MEAASITVTIFKMDKLKAVFDLCDDQDLGYISVEHFSELAREHFGVKKGERGWEVRNNFRNLIFSLDYLQFTGIYFFKM